MPLPRILTAAPHDWRVHLEIAKAIQTLFGQIREQDERQPLQPVAAMREREMIERIVRGIPREFAPVLHAELRKSGYNPNEPRVPAGSAHGGEWTSGGGSQGGAGAVPARGPQYAQEGTGTRTDASGRKGPILSRDIPADDPKHPVPFVDSNGNPITDDQGNQLVRPADLPPETYIREGRLSTLGAVIAGWKQIEESEPAPLAGVLGAIYMALAPFGQAGSLDAERFQGQYVTDYRDYANIAIGIYMAAAGVDMDDALAIADLYAKFKSHFGPDEKMDEVYTHSAKRDINDIRRGYELYNSGRIGKSS